MVNQFSINLNAQHVNRMTHFDWKIVRLLDTLDTPFFFVPFHIHAPVSCPKMFILQQCKHFNLIYSFALEGERDVNLDFLFRRFRF